MSVALPLQVPFLPLKSELGLTEDCCEPVELDYPARDGPLRQQGFVRRR